MVSRCDSFPSVILLLSWFVSILEGIFLPFCTWMKVLHFISFWHLMIVTMPVRVSMALPVEWWCILNSWYLDFVDGMEGPFVWGYSSPSCVNEYASFRKKYWYFPERKGSKRQNTSVHLDLLITGLVKTRRFNADVFKIHWRQLISQMSFILNVRICIRIVYEDLSK